MKHLVILFLLLTFFSHARPTVKGSAYIIDTGNCWYYAESSTEGLFGFVGDLESRLLLNGIGGTNDGNKYYGTAALLLKIRNRTWDNYFPHQTALRANVTHLIHDYAYGLRSGFSTDFTTSHCPTSGGGDDACEGSTEPNNWDPLNQDPCDSPIILDLAGDGIACSDKNGAVLFDLWGSGTSLRLNWTLANSDDAFLAIDLNQNGKIDDGRELFGSGTRMWLQEELFAANGFVGLAQYDFPQLGGNGDGDITPSDAVWSQLILWLDSNANGISDPGEQHSLDAFGYTMLETIPKQKRRFDEHGNWFRYWATADSIHGPRDMIDIYFKRHPLETDQPSFSNAD